MISQLLLSLFCLSIIVITGCSSESTMPTTAPRKLALASQCLKSVTTICVGEECETYENYGECESTADGNSVSIPENGGGSGGSGSGGDDGSEFTDYTYVSCNPGYDAITTSNFTRGDEVLSLETEYTSTNTACNESVYNIHHVVSYESKSATGDSIYETRYTVHGANQNNIAYWQSEDIKGWSLEGYYAEAGFYLTGHTLHQISMLSHQTGQDSFESSVQKWIQ